MSVQNHTNFPAANAQYIGQFGDKGTLALPPAKKVRAGLIIFLHELIAFYSSLLVCILAYGPGVKYSLLVIDSDVHGRAH